MAISILIQRLFIFALVGAACLWLTARTGPWMAAAIWSGGIAVICVLIALCMHAQAPGRITIVNRIAGLILPWGFAIGRGTLAPIVIESTLRWALLGAAFIVVAQRGMGAAFGLAPASSVTGYQPNPLVLGLLVLSWIIFAAVLFRLITANITRANPGLAPDRKSVV